jgi:hypothetical protein
MQYGRRMVPVSYQRHCFPPEFIPNLVRLCHPLRPRILYEASCDWYSRSYPRLPTTWVDSGPSTRLVALGWNSGLNQGKKTYRKPVIEGGKLNLSCSPS